MRILLNGRWQFKDYLGEDWRLRNAYQPVHRDTRHWREGSVPGSVHHDLWTAGAIPNPYFEQNSLLLEWIPQRTWVYRRAFTVDEALRGKQARLCFEGVDYEAEFFLNGVSLGHHRSMYTPAQFDVTDVLVYGGENTIAVVIAPAPLEQMQVGRTSLVRTHKSRMTYWWDFCPRMIHVGIWQDVYLEFTGAARIEDVFARPQLAPDFSRADVVVQTQLSSPTTPTVELETVIRLEGEVVARQRQQHTVGAEQEPVTTSLSIEQPKLWYPNTDGNSVQPLYDVEVTVRDPASAEVWDQRSVRIGIRTVEFVANEDAAPDALPYTLVVNGRKFYINGWNWVPIDVMYGVPRPEKLERLFTLAQRAHVNLLRVWGGGLIETEAFYEQADRRGILVWQEFIQSSSGIENDAPRDPDFIDFMVREAEQIIPRKRNHPSLAIWCGGNELQTGDDLPADDTHPMLAALKATVHRLDPDRMWLPTSSSGPGFMNSLANIERDPQALHDVHGPWEYQGVTAQYTLYNRGASLLHSEFGVEGMTNRKALDATIAPEHQWPVTLDNVLWQHLGAWWVKAPLWREVFGDTADTETLRRATQFMQAEGLRYALEADRRRQFHNSGTLPWQFNEPYPMAACTSSVDYYAQPKPVYYAVAKAYEPVHVSAQYPTLAWAGRDGFEADVWVSSAREQPLDGAQLEARIVGQGGSVWYAAAEAVQVPSNRSAQVASVRLPLHTITDDVFFLDLVLRDSDGSLLSHNRCAFTRGLNLAPLLTVPATTLSVELSVDTQVSGDEWQVTVTNTGGQTALFVWLEDSRVIDAPGYATFSENHVCLFPGERRTVTVSWSQVDEADRSLDVGGWNTGEIMRVQAGGRPT